MSRRIIAPQPPSEHPQPRRTVGHNEAMDFVLKVEARFQNDVTVYRSFLNILAMYRRDEIPITQVYQEVADLFREEEDLLYEFVKFLPDTSGAAILPQPPAGNNSSS